MTKIKDLKPKDDVETVFLTKYISLMESRDGKKYLNIVFSDSTGDIEGRVWQDAEDFYKKINKGDFVQTKGKVNFYQGRRQLVASSLDVVPESQVNVDDFMAKSERSAEEMYKELVGLVDKLDDFYIRELLTKVLADSEIARRLKIWQAGKTIHHAYQSGLLEHILSCTNLAFLLSDHYKANKNFVVAGAILHDLCKIYELTSGVNVDYTEEGKLIGHLVKSIEIVDRFSYKIKNFPYNTKLHLKHVLLSHHGKLEFGSPKTPLTKEAFLLHLIDLMDSRMGVFDEVKRSDATAGHWSGYVKALDSYVFKAELPHYEKELSDEEFGETKSLSSNNDKKKSKGPKRNQELKQNLGELLGDFKVKS
ncbi:MAG: HD domain-containing protein [Halobacteriovoraceae bacterium]|nr:HD domain-containing protein [Halobacteriovoraceae bacterium]MCB9095786.1 HD domain-containing protein [Halobacteriovoraceae bacterium]